MIIKGGHRDREDRSAGDQNRGRREHGQVLCQRLQDVRELRDSKDTVYPFFESDTLFLEGCLYCFSCLASLRIEGCLNVPSHGIP